MLKLRVLIRIWSTIGLLSLGACSLDGLASPLRDDTISGPHALERGTAELPLRISSNGRYLTDKTGSPVLINGDSAWYLFNGATLESLDHYLTVRKRQGFNALLMMMTDPRRPENMYGEVPYLVPGDFTKPNDAYFDRVEQYVSIMQRKGFLAIVNPAYLGYGAGDDGYFREMVAMGPENMKAYGRYIGARFRKFSNIIWFMGGDTPPADALPVVRAVAEGILETDRTNTLFTTHNARHQSGVRFYEKEPWLNVNSTYSDCASAAKHNDENYKRVPVLPFMFFEGSYETTDPRSSDEQCVLGQAYQTILQGGMGHFMGNWGVFFFDLKGDWKPHLHSNAGKTLGFFRKLMESRSWHTLRPDNSNSLVPVGHGSLTDRSGSYVTAAISTAADSALIYFPYRKTVSVRLDRLSGSAEVIAWWYDPSSGKARKIGSFPTRGPREFSANGGMVLVLDNAASQSPPPGEAQ